MFSFSLFKQVQHSVHNYSHFMTLQSNKNPTDNKKGTETNLVGWHIWCVGNQYWGGWGGEENWCPSGPVVWRHQIKHFLTAILKLKKKNSFHHVQVTENKWSWDESFFQQVTLHEIRRVPSFRSAQGKVLWGESPAIPVNKRGEFFFLIFTGISQHFLTSSLNNTIPALPLDGTPASKYHKTNQSNCLELKRAN